MKTESPESIARRLKACKERYGVKLKCHDKYRPHPAHLVKHSWYMQQVLRNAIMNGVIM